MRRDRKNDWHPATTGLSLFFAMVAAGLVLVRIAIGGGLPTVMLIEAPIAAIVVAGLATAGATLGTPGGAMDIGLAGLPARA